jgi:CheY-like chemotaxis protein
VEIDRDGKKLDKTVLVVDDSPKIRELLADALLSDGFTTCVEAENGQEAIATAEQVKPDLIILDLSMPIMDGLEAAPALRRVLPETPIILFSLYGDRVSAAQASQAGVNLVLAKTVPLRMLLDKASELVGD